MMEMTNNNRMHDLLVKYLAGETDPDEEGYVKSWISASPDNSRYFSQLKQLWDAGGNLAVNRPVDEDVAWLRLRKRMQAKEEPAVKKFRPAYGRLRVAASVILLCLAALAGYYIYTGKLAVTESLVQTHDGVSDTVLPDGSEITLNKNSRLSYPSRFTGSTRPVKLEGEAFFKVAHNKAKPFLISVNDVTVRVLGTSFNIKSRQGKTEVVVATGIVEVSRQQQKMQLRPGEKVTALNDADFVKERVRDRLYDYYHSRRFVCNQTPLYELVEALNEAYGAEIVIENDSLKNRPITTVLSNQSLDQVLTVISETFNIRVQRRGGQIILN